MLVVVTVTVNDGAAKAAPGNSAANAMSAMARVSKRRSGGCIDVVSFPKVMVHYPDDA
jgi:hypothetical protein